MDAQGQEWYWLHKFITLLLTASTILPHLNVKEQLTR